MVYIVLGVLLHMLLFLGHSADGELVFERFEFARFDPATFTLEEGGHFDVLFRFVKFAFVVVLHFVLESLLTHRECLLVHLVVLLGLFEFEGRNADLQNCLAGCIANLLPFFFDAGRIATDKN